ncbi:MAG: hypothetical protein WCA00_06045, partial [Candidatus Acidiferrales bacterium]
ATAASAKSAIIVLQKAFQDGMPLSPAASLFIYIANAREQPVLIAVKKHRAAWTLTWLSGAA